MLSDWELWAVANEVLEQHRGDAPLFVAARLGDLAVKGDAAGIATWQAVARRIATLMAAAPARPAS